MVIKIVLSIFLLYEVSNYNIKACEIKKSGLSAADKARLVDAHNRLRAKVANGQQDGQPSAANMKQLKWNDELAAKAQEWANTCNSGHDTYDDRKTSTFSLVGQNFYAYYAKGSGSDRKIDMNNPVQAWYDEVKDFNKNIVKKYKSDGSNTGHYTQVVWANTNSIGCGYVSFPNGDWIQQNVICNYGPAGNIISQPVYLEGRSASDCGGSVSTQYPGLCSS